MDSKTEDQAELVEAQHKMWTLGQEIENLKREQDEITKKIMLVPKTPTANLQVGDDECALRAWEDDNRQSMAELRDYDRIAKALGQKTKEWKQLSLEHPSIKRGSEPEIELVKPLAEQVDF